MMIGSSKSLVFEGISGHGISVRVAVVRELSRRGGAAKLMDLVKALNIDPSSLRKQVRWFEDGRVAEGVNEPGHGMTLRLKLKDIGLLRGEQRELFDVIWDAWTTVSPDASKHNDMTRPISHRDLINEMGWASKQLCRVLRDLERMEWIETRLHGQGTQMIVPSLPAIVLKLQEVRVPVEVRTPNVPKLPRVAPPSAHKPAAAKPKAARAERDEPRQVTVKGPTNAPWKQRAPSKPATPREVIIRVTPGQQQTVLVVE